MKKIIFAFATLLVMVCTALSFTSCGDDNDSSNNMQCTGYWTVAYESGKTETTQSSSLLSQLNARAKEVMGTSFLTDYDQKTTKLTESQIATIGAKMEADSQCKSLITQLLALDNIYEVIYYIKCGDVTVGVFYEEK